MDEKIELKYNEITELYEKISEAMRMSDEKATNIAKMILKLYDETRPEMVEMKKEDLEKAKSEKEEFDKMTKDALINMKKDILRLRKETEEKYNQKLLDTLEQKKKLEHRVESVRKNMEEKGFDAEKIESVENRRKAAEQKINESMIEFQNKHFEIIKKLDEYEKNITKFAVELDFIDELDKVSTQDTPEKETVENEASIENEDFQLDDLDIEADIPPASKETSEYLNRIKECKDLDELSVVMNELNLDDRIDESQFNLYVRPVFEPLYDKFDEKEKSEEDLAWKEYEKNDGFIDNKRKLGIENPEREEKNQRVIH